MTQDWIEKRDALKEHGLVPYVCTSELFLNHLDLDVLGPGYNCCDSGKFERLIVS